MKPQIYILICMILFLLLSISGVVAVGIFPEVDDDAFSYFRFNNDSITGENYGVSNITYDYSFFVNNATQINGIIYNQTGGYLGDGAFEFYRNSSQYIYQNNFFGSENATAISISAWIYARNNTSLQNVVGDIDTSTRQAIGLSIRTDGKIGAQCNDKDSLLSDPSTAISPNIWYHAVVTYSLGHCRLYLNGVLISDMTTAQGYLRTANSRLYIGEWGTFNNNALNGSVDEIMIINRTITEDEVSNMYSIYTGAECGVNPFNGCSVTTSTTINNSNDYDFNGSTTGAIIFRANNIVFDCNGTNITGNYQETKNTTIKGINLYTSQNVTLKNCNIDNYNFGIYTDRATGNIFNNKFSQNRVGININKFNNSNIYSNDFLNNSYSGIWFYGIGTSTNIYFNNFNYNNIGVRSESFYQQNINISNNSFYMNDSDGGSGISMLTGNNWLIDKNNLYGSNKILSEIMTIAGQNTTISNNWMDKTQYNIWVKNSTGIAYNITIINNTILNGGQGSTLGFYGGKLIYFLNNTVRNMTIGDSLDGYSVGLKVSSVSDVYIIGNNFTEIATVGVLSQGSYNVTIKNNFFDFIPLNERYKYGAKDTGQSEPRCAIQSTKRYKRFYDSFGNYNLTVFGNIFDLDTPCYLHLENQTILTHDLSNYWYSSFLVNISYAGLREFYIPNYYNNLSGWDGTKVFYEFTIYSVPKIENIIFNISKSLESYRNFNLTTPYLLSKFNLTSSFLLFSNSSLMSNINGDINISLNPNDWVKIYSDGNCPSGYSYRDSTCKKNTLSIESDGSCLDGYTFMNGECNLNIIDEPEEGCPINYVDLGDTCELSITNSCSESVKAFVSYISLLGLIGVLVLIGWGVAYLTGFIDKSQLKGYMVMTSMVTIIVVGFALIVGILLLNAICTLF